MTASGGTATRSRVSGGVLAGFVAGALLAGLLANAPDNDSGDGGPGAGGQAVNAGEAIGGVSAGETPTAAGSDAFGGGGPVTTGVGSAAGTTPGGGGVAGEETTIPAAGNVRGVTDTTVKLGLGYLDTSSVSSLFPTVGKPEDYQRMVASVLTRWERQGRLVVHGRRIEVKLRNYQIFRAEQERSACVAFAQEDKVFAAVVDAMNDGLECLTREMKIPTVMSYTFVAWDDLVARTWPYLFGIQPHNGSYFRNLAHWLHTQQILKGKRLGIYASNNQAMQRGLDQSLRKVLNELGYPRCANATATSCLAADVQGQDCPGCGAVGEASGVTQLRTAGVDLVLGLSVVNLEALAEQQGYQPDYVGNEWPGVLGVGEIREADVQNQHRPAQFDGTPAMISRRHSYQADGIPTWPEGAECIRDFQAAGGRKPMEIKLDYNLIQAVLSVCSALDVMHAGLERAGRNLSVQTFVAGMESIRGLNTAWWPSVSYAPNKHFGAATWRTVRYRSGRSPTAWVEETAPQPLWVT